MVFLFFFLVNNQTKRTAKKSSLSESTSLNPKWETIGGTVGQGRGQVDIEREKDNI